MFHFLGASAEQQELYSSQGINRPWMIDDLVVHYREINRRLYKQGKGISGADLKKHDATESFASLSPQQLVLMQAGSWMLKGGFRNVLSRLINWTFNAFFQRVSHLLQMHESSDLAGYTEVHLPLNDSDVYPSRLLSVISLKEKNTGSGRRTRPT